jgi:hypothetical protein
VSESAPSVPPDATLCSNLRSPKYYLLDRPPRSGRELLDASGECWCNRTMMRIGPDHDSVHPDHCTSRRACYRPLEVPLHA